MLSACFVAKVMGATLAYRFYERPPNRLRRRVLLPRQPAWSGGPATA